VHRLTLRASSLLPAAVLTAVTGHWVANALFDRDEYAGAGADVVGRLHDPAIVQSAIALVIIGVLASWDRVRSRRGRVHVLAGIGPNQLVLILLGVQVFLFVALEASERMVIETLSTVPTGVEPLGAGFVSELIVAIGSAILLAVLCEATARIVASLRRRSGRPVSLGDWVPFDESGPPRNVLVGAGRERAPPRRSV
jgi:hypothetical protein